LPHATSLGKKSSAINDFAFAYTYILAWDESRSLTLATAFSHELIEEPIMTKATESTQRGIQLTENALKQVLFLQDKQGKDLYLRVGVRQGGCSGMSYMMDFTEASAIGEQDDVFDYEGFKIVCDRKSLLYLYGLVLDYSDAMIGGGFQFTNPNAAQSCGCGKSFSV
jgi:iron-sulfur cluster assembly protein